MKMKRAILQTTIAAVAMLIDATPLRAAAIFDNLDTPTTAGVIAPLTWFGQSFTVGATPATLTSAVLRMGNAGNPVGGFFVQLWSATGDDGRPGTSLGPLSGSANPATADDYTYTGSYALAANTSYYIVAGVHDTPQLLGGGNGGNGGTGMYWWSMTQPMNLPSGSSTIGYSGWNGSFWTGPPHTDGAFNLQVNGDFTPVPEPEAWAALSFAVLGLVWFVKSRRESARA